MANDFLESIRRVITALEEIDELLVVSHYDCDGLSSACIVAKALHRWGKDFQLFIAKELTKEVMSKLRDYDLPVLFLDLGESKLVNMLKQPAFILDHHAPAGLGREVVRANPEDFGIHELSGSAVAYYFAKLLDERNRDCSDLALVGAAGDMQLKDMLGTELGKAILEDAEGQGLIDRIYELKLFGYSSRPLHLALSYCFDPFLPGISGNESAAVQLLAELGIRLKDEEGKFRTLADLSEKEKEKLRTQLVLLRSAHGIKDAESLFDWLILLRQYGYEVNEFATILNAIGRLERYELALSIVKEFQREQLEGVLRDYQRRLAKELDLAQQLLELEGDVALVDGCGKLSVNLASPIATILTQLLEAKIVIVVASEGEEAKFSVRNKLKLPINEIVRELAQELGGEGGGHLEACGARVPIGEKDEFIARLRERLSHVV